MNDISTAAIRIFVYTHIADTGGTPSATIIAEHFSVTGDAAHAMLETLAIERAVILHPVTREIRMAGPFSATPTRFRVHGARASYWANCAWDMMGNSGFLAESTRVEAVCADCNEVSVIDVDVETGPSHSDGLVHITLPARRWYEDIGFT
jgi:hypothetical protein